MKHAVYFFIAFLVLSCGSSQKTTENDLPEGAVRIANEELEYEIIIIDIGYQTYLNTVAQPVGFYSLEYLETRNKLYVAEWNNRVRNPQMYNPNIYEMEINYNPNIRYGMDVNYKLFNYFKFVEYRYKQNFFLSRN